MGGIFPWKRHLTIAGLFVVAALASLSETWAGCLVAGGLFSVVVSMSRSGRAAGRPVPAPASSCREALWDPWLDVEGCSDLRPHDRESGGGGEDSTRGPIVPALARVRPRVLAAGGEGSMPLEGEVLPFTGRGECGAIWISGPPGSGKTTALRHLAAVLPPGLDLTILDDPDGTLLADRSARGLVVYASGDSTPKKHLATYRLAPWGDDERIEYLLATAGERCASVMTRLGAATDPDFLGGTPELWRVSLDRMAADGSLPGVRDALRRELAARLADPELRSRVEALCHRLLTNPDAVQPERAELLAKCCGDGALLRLIRHRPVQVLVAAGRIAHDLEDGGPCGYLRQRLPRDLVREAATLIRDRPQAIDRLGGLLDGDDRTKDPMVTSLLHATQTVWRPPSARVPVLSGAYLDRAAWAGLDLAWVEMEGADLFRADLSGARLDHARADKALLRQAVLRGASLHGATARKANLTRADLSSIRAEAVQFQAANLEGANLEGASLRKARLDEANLTGARLREVDLYQANLEGADIAGADFCGAKLVSATLKGLDLRIADFTRVSFEHSVLAGCNLEGLVLPRADFEHARLCGALLTGSSMPGANFRGADLRGAGLAEIEWEGACLAGADLRQVSFHLGSSRSGLVQSPIACEGSRTGFYTDDFNEQDFKAPEEIRKANLRGADLRGARVANADFYLVDLRDALFDADQAAHFRRCGAILVDRA